MTDPQQDQHPPAPSPAWPNPAPVIDVARAVQQSGPRAASPMVRKYLGKCITIRFGSGHIEVGKLVDIDQLGVFGRLDRGYWADGTRRAVSATPEPQMASINLRRAEVIV